MLRKLLTTMLEDLTWDQELKDILLSYLNNGRNDDDLQTYILEEFDVLMEALALGDSFPHLQNLKMRKYVRAIIREKLLPKSCYFILQFFGMCRKKMDTFSSKDANVNKRKHKTIAKYLEVVKRLSDFSYDEEIDVFHEVDEYLKKYFPISSMEIIGLTEFYIPKGVTINTGTSHIEKAMVNISTRRRHCSDLTRSIFKAIYQRQAFTNCGDNTINIPTSCLDESYSEELAFVPKKPDIYRIIIVQGVRRLLDSIIRSKGLKTILSDYGLRIGKERFKTDFADQSYARRLGTRITSGQNHGFTVDLSSASDSISHVFMEKYLPYLSSVLKPFSSLHTIISDEYVMRVIKELCPEIVIDDTHIETPIYTGMGSVFCFPLQTLIFYVIAYTAIKPYMPTNLEGKYNKYLNVYGDDIIFSVPQDMVSKTAVGEAYFACLDLLSKYGFKPNDSKSFGTDTSMKEVCGLFSYRGIDVRPINLRSNPTWINLERDVGFYNHLMMKGFKNLSALFLDWMIDSYGKNRDKLSFSIYDTTTTQLLDVPWMARYTEIDDNDGGCDKLYSTYEEAIKDDTEEVRSACERYKRTRGYFPFSENLEVVEIISNSSKCDSIMRNMYEKSHKVTISIKERVTKMVKKISVSLTKGMRQPSTCDTLLTVGSVASKGTMKYMGNSKITVAPQSFTKCAYGKNISDKDLTVLLASNKFTELVTQLKKL
jgi:hypothetical protein